MDQETLFTSSKWEILKVLSKGQKSPLELARETKTSIANISQQLRMLELANIVKSVRVGNRERGEPRLLYSLAGPTSYLIAALPNFAEKKQLILSPYHEAILKIWFLKDETSHYYIEKFFWEIEPKLERIEIIAAKTDFSRIKLAIISEDADLKKEIKSKDIKKPKGPERRIDVFVLSKSQFLAYLSEEKEFSLRDELSIIYDPKADFGKIKGKVEAKA